jgi:hypothetical protein
VYSGDLTFQEIRRIFMGKKYGGYVEDVPLPVEN